MDEQRNNSPSKAQGEECSRQSCMIGKFGPFFLGLVVALVFGWWVFPYAMFTSTAQPIAFNHKVHVEDAALECTQCHSVREDGSFAAFSPIENCASCHAQMLGDSDAERKFYTEYIQTGKDVEWKVYARQPDNVFFSHAAHSLANCGTCHMDFTEKDLCTQCHIPVAESASPPPFEENRLSGYSKNIMKMAECESCHANPNHLGITNASNACFVCHK